MSYVSLGMRGPQSALKRAREGMDACLLVSLSSDARMRLERFAESGKVALNTACDLSLASGACA